MDEPLSPGGPTGPPADVFLFSRTRLDAQIEYRLPDGLELYANGFDLHVR